MATFRMTVDGKRVSVNAEPEMPLLYALRNDLGLNNPHFGCGLAQCGACTVHLDGQPIRSCQTPISSVGAAPITTIEGLGGTHPVQAAWIRHDVPQCGYCQSGQIMSAAALLAHAPHPSDEEINAAMQGNVCRCGAYQRIRAAIKDATTPAAPTAATSVARGAA